MKTKELIKAHLYSTDEEFVKEYESNPPHVAEKLQWQPGEAIISELSKKDLTQLWARYNNDIVVFEKNILHMLLRIEKLLTFLAEEKGINVKEAFRKDAQEREKELEEQQAKLKKQLENYKAN
jgi:hypothetical protein